MVICWCVEMEFINENQNIRRKCTRCTRLSGCTRSSLSGAHLVQAFSDVKTSKCTRCTRYQEISIVHFEPSSSCKCIVDFAQNMVHLVQSNNFTSEKGCTRSKTHLVHLVHPIYIDKDKIQMGVI